MHNAQDLYNTPMALRPSSGTEEHEGGMLHTRREEASPDASPPTSAALLRTTSAYPPKAIFLTSRQPPHPSKKAAHGVLLLVSRCDPVLPSRLAHIRSWSNPRKAGSTAKREKKLMSAFQDIFGPNRNRLVTELT